MASYNVGGVWDNLHKNHKSIVDAAESVQATADDPTKNEMDIFRDIMDFQSESVPNDIGKRIVLAAMGGNFKVNESIIQEIK